MTYCFYIAACLCLLIFQTTIVPYLPFLDSFYDLLLPFILYLGLFRSVAEGLPVVLFLGFIMDSLSGGPFGLNLTAYLWLFIGMMWVIKFLHVGNSLLLLFVVAIGVLIENFIFIGTIAVLEPGTRLPSVASSTVSAQVLWAICTGPFFLMFFNYMHKRWNKWLNERFEERNGYSGN